MSKFNIGCALLFLTLLTPDAAAFINRSSDSLFIQAVVPPITRLTLAVPPTFELSTASGVQKIGTLRVQTNTQLAGIALNNQNSAIALSLGPCPMETLPIDILCDVIARWDSAPIGVQVVRATVWAVGN